MQDSKHKGTVLIYAIILVNFAVILGYMIFSRSQILYENSRFSQMNTKLSKNIEERGSASIEYDIALNQTGSGFLDTTNCPVLSLSGTNLGSTYTENIPTTVDKIGTEVYCSGSSVSHT